MLHDRSFNPPVYQWSPIPTTTSSQFTHPFHRSSRLRVSNEPDKLFAKHESPVIDSITSTLPIHHAPASWQPRTLSNTPSTNSIFPPIQAPEPGTFPKAHQHQNALLGAKLTKPPSHQKLGTNLLEEVRAAEATEEHHAPPHKLILQEETVDIAPLKSMGFSTISSLSPLHPDPGSPLPQNRAY
jgi:hypothetical protein